MCGKFTPCVVNELSVIKGGLQFEKIIPSEIFWYVLIDLSGMH